MNVLCRTLRRWPFAKRTRFYKATLECALMTDACDLAETGPRVLSG
jgi:hypothetical protein